MYPKAFLCHPPSPHFSESQHGLGATKGSQTSGRTDKCNREPADLEKACWIDVARQMSRNPGKHQDIQQLAGIHKSKGADISTQSSHSHGNLCYSPEERKWQRPNWRNEVSAPPSRMEAKQKFRTNRHREGHVRMR